MEFFEFTDLDFKVMDLFLKHKVCPDCGSSNFLEGPTGGGAQNVKCSGCGHWYNCIFTYGMVAAGKTVFL